MLTPAEIQTGAIPYSCLFNSRAASLYLLGRIAGITDPAVIQANSAGFSVPVPDETTTLFLLAQLAGVTEVAEIVSGSEGFASLDERAAQIYLLAQIAENGLSPTMKVYRAVLSQNGTDAPAVFAELENTLGAPVVWTRNSAGVYTGTLVGAFPPDKTFLLSNYDTNYGQTGGHTEMAVNTLDSVSLTAYVGATPTDPNDGGNHPTLYVEILVYP